MPIFEKNGMNIGILEYWIIKYQGRHQKEHKLLHLTWSREQAKGGFDVMNLAKIGEFPPDEYQKQPVIAVLEK